MKNFKNIGAILLAGAVAFSTMPAGLAAPIEPAISVPTTSVVAAVTAPKASSVSLSASAKVTYANAGVLSGTVTYTHSKAPIGKATVTIQRKSGTKWIKVAAVTTDTKGKYRYSARNLTKSTTYRAVVSKTAKYKAAVSSSRTIAVVPAPSTITLAAPASVAQKGTAALKGIVKITKTKAPVSKASVVIQRKSGTKWIDVTTVTTDAKGVYRYNARSLTKNVTYRAVVKKTVKFTSAISPQRTVSVKQVITMTSYGSKTFTSGTAIKVSGTVTPGLYSKQLQLQKSVNGVWTTLKKIPVSSTGKFSSSVPIYGSGAGQKLRVVGASAPAKSWSVNIYAWYSLSDMESLSRSGNFEDGSTVEFRGVVYPKSLRFLWSARSFGGWDDGSVSYNLGYKCTKFESQVGVDDQSEGALAAWSYTVARDGVESSTGYIGLGKDQKLTADLSSVLRLELKAIRKDTTGWNYKPYKADASWGSPRVLCLGAP